MADRYFLNVGTNFNTTANWSTTSGGASGASVPASGDRIILDANSGNLSLEVNINVQGILMSAGYINTFTQNAFTINYGSAWWTVNGGVFVGSSSAITGSSSSRFVMTAGTFTSTSGVHTVGVAGIGTYSLDITGGVFNHNNGTMLISGSNHTNARNLIGYPFYNFEFNMCPSCTLAGTGIYVANNLVGTLNNYANGGSLVAYVKGNVTFALGSVSVVFEGTGNQDFNVTGAIVVNAITINKPSGTLNIINDFAWYGNWNHIVGTINWNSKKAIARFTNNGITITNGQFHHLEQNCTSGVGVGWAGTQIQCEGDFILNAQTGANNFPPVRFRGNLSILTANGNCSGAIFNGTGAQSFTSSVASYQVPIDVNKSGGTVTLMSNFTMLGATNDFNMISGTFNQNGFNLVIPDAFNQTGGIYNQGAGVLDLLRFVSTLGTFNEGSQGIICRGTDFIIGIASVFNRSLIGGGLFANTAVGTALLLTTNGWTLSNFSFARLTASLTLGSSLTINGYYKKSSTATTANVIGAGFMVRIGGNVEQNNLYSSRVLATSPTFLLNGASDQTVTSSDGKLDSGIWQVNKPSGKVTQLSAITIDNGQAGDNGLNNLVILAGAWCTNNFNLTVDGTIIVLSSAELRKTPLSTITGTLAGVITNVNSCDEKKTAFFLVE
jgi:hypothetical protein